MITNNYSAGMQSYCAPSFKGVNLIQVSKKAFVGAENIMQKEFMFHNCINKVTGDGKKPIREILSILGLIRDRNKALSFLETPCYTQNLTTLKEKGLSHLPFEWLEQNAGVKLSPLRLDKDSFWVLTGKDKDVAASIQSAKNRFNIGIDLDPEIQVTDIQYDTMLNSLIDKQVFDAIKNTPVQKFNAETLEDVENIARKIDYNV